MACILFLISSASASLASPGPPGPHYGPRPPLAGPAPFGPAGPHYGPRPPLAGPAPFGPAGPHYGPRPPLGGPGYYPGYSWGYFGIGLLTGAFLSAAVAPPPPRPATVVYKTAPAVVYQPAPAVVVQQTTTTPAPNVVLRQVIPIPTLLNVRNNPDLNANILGQVRSGEVLDVIGTAPGWLYIRTGTGNYGWVMEQFIRNRDQPAG